MVKCTISTQKRLRMVRHIIFIILKTLTMLHTDPASTTRQMIDREFINEIKKP